MHDAAYTYLLRHSAIVPHGPILEIGSRFVNGTARALFPACPAYIGIDLIPGRCVDTVADGATYLPPIQPVGIVCAEVLEHTASARDICRHAAEVLGPGGVLLLTAAGEGRAPHSAVDGGPLRAGEYYRNVTTDDLQEWLGGFRDTQIEVNAVAGDIYARAVK